MAIEYGTAVAKELPQLVELLGILFAQEAEFTPDAEKQKKGLEAILADPKVGKVYVARENKKILGMATLLFTVSTAEGGKAAA